MSSTYRMARRCGVRSLRRAPHLYEFRSGREHVRLPLRQGRLLGQADLRVQSEAWRTRKDLCRAVRIQRGCQGRYLYGGRPWLESQSPRTCRHRSDLEDLAATPEALLESLPSLVPSLNCTPYSATFRTLKKASCGSSIEPICFIRFFPSFCFSKSFRFRVMSPP